MTSSYGGSIPSVSGNSWTLPVPRDTTPEASALQQAIWRDTSPVDRATWWLRRDFSMLQARLSYLRRQHPELSQQELIALWTEERYREHLPAEFLARACAAIRNYRPDQATESNSSES